MLPTGNQLSQNIRKAKTRRNKVAAFMGAPVRKGIVYKIAVMSPRKPNSAKRTFAKIKININQKKIFAKIPGIGDHYLQAHSVVLVRGHGPKDSPGINYHLIRGVYDFNRIETYGRKNRRSKFGVKI
jgi:small subunit ribosomal protein S12